MHFFHIQSAALSLRAQLLWARAGQIAPHGKSFVRKCPTGKKVYFIERVCRNWADFCWNQSPSTESISWCPNSPYAWLSKPAACPGGWKPWAPQLSSLKLPQGLRLLCLQPGPVSPWIRSIQLLFNLAQRLIQPGAWQCWPQHQGTLLSSIMQGPWFLLQEPPERWHLNDPRPPRPSQVRPRFSIPGL